MAATPQYGVFKFIGLRSRKSYNVDAYISDVAAAQVRFDGGAGASSTSPDFWTPPETVILADVAIVTGTVDTAKMQLTVNGRPTSDYFRYAMHLTTLANRPSLAIGVGQGQQLRAIQSA